MFSTNSDKAWRHYGGEDPYYGVMSEERFRGAPDQATRAAFFDAGRRHIDLVFAEVHKHLHPDFAPRRALDHGCGAGRLVVALAARAEEVVGIDVSEAMLTEALRNCDEAGRSNVAFALADDKLSALEGTFDLVHSYIVLQHVPPRRGLVILDALVHRVALGGVGAIHVIVAGPRRGLHGALNWSRGRVPGFNTLVCLVRRQPIEPLIEMNVYDLNRIVDQIEQAGGRNVVVSLQRQNGWLGALVLFSRTGA